MRILVLGSTGMLGHTVFRWLSRDAALTVAGTLRDQMALSHFTPDERSRLRAGVDVLDEASLAACLRAEKPDVVINCVGVIKQLAAAHDPLVVLPINAMLPHRLSRLCASGGARLIHVSTDCVFAGTRGNYREDDVADTQELYGQSKYIGEVRDQPHVLTLRVSIIGHELASANSLVDWFLSQSGSVDGYTRAIFSGLPTVTLAEVFRTVVLPRPHLHGLYHVSAAPISKHDLLQLVGREYGHTATIRPSERVVIDRSLNSDAFQAATGYVPASWPQLVAEMHRWRAI